MPKQENFLNDTPLDKSSFLNRRSILKALLGTPLSVASASALARGDCDASLQLDKLNELTPKKLATKYNNYYEFSTEKEAVHILAKELKTEPWTIEVDGLVENAKKFAIADFSQFCQLDRIYRFRCVEGWSMVVPWQGIALGELIKSVKPLAQAKFVKFTSVYRPSEMIGQRRPTLEWPYVEALRLDEAMHPLSMLATGMYGEAISAQNGAPVRLVVPWKYGFKSIKAVTKIELVAEQPITTWMQAAPREYGFYGNVNPSVRHPRWSQKREVALGELKKKKTLMFNGYAEFVSDMYADMDLETHF